MNSIPPISEWRRIFVDTSFIIDAVRNLQDIDKDYSKYHYIVNTQKLLEHFQLVKESKQEIEVRWITSSIVLSELSKFENKDAVDELQIIFDSPEIEIVNFTRKEASFIVNDMGKYLDQKHVNQYLKEMKEALASNNIFNPKNYISNDALIIACAKSKSCDVVLSSDRKSFMPIAKQVNLPILLSKDIPLGLHRNVESELPIKPDY